MSNKSRKLYVGLSSDLPRRVDRHKLKIYPDSFTARYSFDMLVWYEEHSNFRSARAREVELKGWRREKKLALILAANPDWADLSLECRITWAGSLNLMLVQDCGAGNRNRKISGAVPSPAHTQESCVCAGFGMAFRCSGNDIPRPGFQYLSYRSATQGRGNNSAAPWGKEDFPLLFGTELATPRYPHSKASDFSG
jgi:putative endonuclease